MKKVVCSIYYSLAAALSNESAPYLLPYFIGHLYLRSKNQNQEDMCLKEIGLPCSKFVNHSMCSKEIGLHAQNLLATVP